MHTDTPPSSAGPLASGHAKCEPAQAREQVAAVAEGTEAAAAAALSSPQ